ncbi:hypothetical protein [Thiocapsa bogorovii]|uniref:hypothetical protein n=1 Tax=Thiocapsa bogorovii TaxID=521689 RepID=UPI001E3EC088|nr:hypothetical protein [Thiocapsa bogorovii]UHD14720.1 hypothetical protein LT988_15675 [Thiocapsa bogorovii]
MRIPIQRRSCERLATAACLLLMAASAEADTILISDQDAFDPKKPSSGRAPLL